MTKDRKEQLQYLLAQYVDGQASAGEEETLFRLLANHADDSECQEIIEELMMAEPENGSVQYPGWQSAVEEIVRSGSAANVLPPVSPVAKLRRLRFVWVSAAAAALLVLCLTAFYVFRQTRSEVAGRPVEAARPGEIAPGTDKAVLTLADGRKVVLDTASNGALAQQGGVKVIKLGGELSYKAAEGSGEVLYNTISTPRGGQYRLELPDGTRVWLNAASSLRFPTVFAGKQREVTLTGEGYFEVTHDPTKSFHVRVSDMDVAVLGTHFNINSYSDEPSIKTTLLEGRVTVQKQGKVVYLSPGQQAIVQPEKGDVRVASDVDVDEVVAWKEGRFLFNNADIETVMRQVARWYDVEVVFENRSNKQVAGGLPRSQNIGQLLKILEATGKVSFEIDGKQIRVKSK